VETGHAEKDPTALFSTAALSQPEKRNHAAITDAAGIAGLIRSIRGYEGTPVLVQAIKILEDLQKLTGTGKYVFPSPRTPTRPLSDNGVLSALRRMGYGKDEMIGHGFRAMARTAIEEQLHIDAKYVELQLAHAVKDANGRAYNRTKFIKERIDMMQRWADYLDALADAKTT